MKLPVMPPVSPMLCKSVPVPDETGLAMHAPSTCADDEEVGSGDAID